MLEHSGGISFESIEASEPLNIVQRIADLTHYTGQISFDFIRGNDGEITLLECNPRPTAGIYLIDPKPFVDAVTGSTSTLSVAPPGIQRHVFSALLREMLVNWRQIPEILTELLAPDASDVYWVAGDRLPSLYQFLSFSHVMKYRKSHSGPKPRSDLLSGYLHDISWNGHALG
jgi:hypothetical protein